MNKYLFKTVFLSGLFSILLILSACTLHKRTEPLSNAFLKDVDLSQQIKSLPFQHSWIAPGIKADDYESVLVLPVRTDFIDEDNWVNSSGLAINSAADYFKEAESLARFFQKSLIRNLDFEPNGRFNVTKNKGKYVLVIEIALTEMELARPTVRTASLVVPVPGTGPAVGAITDPHVAFAAKITDGQTGKLLATVADRRFAPKRMIDLKKLQVNKSVREICEAWAKELTQALQKGVKSRVGYKRDMEILSW